MSQTVTPAVKAENPLVRKAAPKPPAKSVRQAATRAAVKAPGKVASSAPAKAPSKAPAKALSQATPKAPVSSTVVAKVSKAPSKAAPQTTQVTEDNTKAKRAPKATKLPKQKPVRDSFSFPEAEYLALVGLKKRLLAKGHDAKKGELVRAGIALLSNLGDAALINALSKIDKLKTGRPAK